MDSLKTLMDKKAYDLVIQITENAKDDQSLFYRITALLASGKPEEALECITLNQKVLSKRLDILIKIHIEILCLLGRFDAAYTQLEYYKNLPYESQIVEETLVKYQKFIREEEKNSLKGNFVSEETIIKRLKSEKSTEVLMGLESVRKQNVEDFMPYIGKILVEFPMQAIRSFALLLLVEKKYEKTIKFNHVGKLIEVKPSELLPPFQDNQFKELVKLINTDFKDPALSQNAINIYSTYLIYIYPDRCKFSTEAMLTALYGVASEFLIGDDSKLDEKALEMEQDIKEIKSIIEELKGSIESF